MVQLMSSDEIYNYLLNEFRNRFSWLRLGEEEITQDVVGLPTVLIDHVINYQFIDRFNAEPGQEDEWNTFFSFIEELLHSDNSDLVEIIDTTILEMLAADHDVKLELVLPYCGSYTRRSICGTISHFYGDPEKAEELLTRYPD